MDNEPLIGLSTHINPIKPKRLRIEEDYANLSLDIAKKRIRLSQLEKEKEMLLSEIREKDDHQKELYDYLKNCEE